jgi:hypothetical protein
MPLTLMPARALRLEWLRETDHRDHQDRRIVITGIGAS